jgi:hypothetical protein
MENPANPAVSDAASTPEAIDARGDSQPPVERFMMPPKEFIHQVYLLSGAVVLLLSLAIGLMMVLA